MTISTCIFVLIMPEPIRLYTQSSGMDVTLFYRQLNLTFQIGRSGKKICHQDIAVLSIVDEGVIWHQYGKGLEFLSSDGSV